MSYCYYTEILVKVQCAMQQLSFDEIRDCPKRFSSLEMSISYFETIDCVTVTETFCKVRYFSEKMTLLYPCLSNYVLGLVLSKKNISKSNSLI